MWAKKEKMIDKIPAVKQAKQNRLEERKNKSLFNLGDKVLLDKRYLPKYYKDKDLSGVILSVKDNGLSLLIATQIEILFNDPEIQKLNSYSPFMAWQVKKV